MQYLRRKIALNIDYKSLKYKKILLINFNLKHYSLNELVTYCQLKSFSYTYLSNLNVKNFATLRFSNEGHETTLIFRTKKKEIY